MSAGSAQAVPAYGYAGLSFTNFGLTGIFGVPGVTVGTTTVLLTDGANYPGFPTSGTSVFGNITTGANVPQATSGPGPFPAENTFVQALTGSSGTRGDGLITGALAGGATSNLVAEGRLTLGAASAGSNAGSATTLNVGFTALAGTVVTLSFNASDFLTASVGELGDTATAQVSASYKICLTTGTKECQDITDTVNGGTSKLVQPEELNQNVASTDPSTPQSFSSPSTFYSFTAVLAPGTYQLTLADNVTEILSTGAPVPEPISIALFGSGLLGLAVIRRRR